MNLLGRLGVGAIDQLVSALSNFVITVGISIVLGLAELGEFALVYAAYTAALGLSRALVSEPVMVTQPDRAVTVDAGWRRSSTSVLLFAGVAALIAAVASFWLGATFAALAVLLPFLLLQDHLRLLSLRARRAVLALASDLAWLSVSVVGIIVMAGAGGTALTAVLWWGAGAVMGIVVLVPIRVVAFASVSKSVGWWHRHARKLGVGLTVASVVYSVGGQALWFIGAAVVGADATGLVRLVQSLFGPLQWLLGSVSLLGLPEAARNAHSLTTKRVALAGITSIAFAGAIATGCVLALPFLFAFMYPGNELPGYDVTVVVAAQFVFSALAVPSGIALRVRLRGSSLAAARFVGVASALGWALTFVSKDQGAGGLAVPFAINAAVYGIITFGLALLLSPRRHND